MTSELGLSDYHQNIIVNYMRFAKFQRGQHLKTVEQSFENIKLSRLLDETFTADEVKDLLDELCALLMADLESDLINTTHTVVLLLCQMCSQAERWYLKLQADISELENRELLEKVDKFDKKFSCNNFDKNSPGSPLKLSKLEPLSEDSGPNKLLMAEIERLTSENKKLNARLKEVENRAFGIIEEKSALSEALMVTKCELTELKERQVDELEQKLKDLEMAKEELENRVGESSEKQCALEMNLLKTQQGLLEAQAQLHLTTKELDQKFSQTAQYQNMKKMLAAKNDQIKALRKQLKEYEPEEEED